MQVLYICNSLAIAPNYPMTQIKVPVCKDVSINDN